jgi:hypothetical protein
MAPLMKDDVNDDVNDEVPNGIPKTLFFSNGVVN